MIYISYGNFIKWYILSEPYEGHLRELLWEDIGALYPDKYVITTFLAGIGRYPPKRMAEELAVEDSSGTWTPVWYETPKVRKEYGAKIVGLINARDNGELQATIKLWGSRKSPPKMLELFDLG
jgi:hypothetical protein